METVNIRRASIVLANGCDHASAPPHVWIRRRHVLQRDDGHVGEVGSRRLDA